MTVVRWDGVELIRSERLRLAEVHEGVEQLFREGHPARVSL